MKALAADPFSLHSNAHASHRPAPGFAFSLLTLLAACAGADETSLSVAESTLRPEAAEDGASGRSLQALTAGPVWAEFGAPEDRLHSVASAVDANARVYFFGLADNQTIWHHVDAPSFGRGWQLFNREDERLAAIAPYRSGDGRIEVIGVSSDDTIWVNQQLSVGGGWSGWHLFGSPDDRLRSVTAIADGAGQNHLFGLAGDGSIWSNVLPSGGSWSGWQPFGDSGNRLATLAAHLSADGRLEVFGTAGTVWMNYQSAAGGGWSGWQMVGDPDDRFRLVVPASDALGDTQVLALADDDSPWIGSLGDGWSGWDALGNPEARLSTLAVAENADGRLEAAGVAADDSVWRTARASPAGAWNPWQPFGSADARLRTLLLERAADDRLLALGTAADGSIWLTAQALPGQWGDDPLPTAFSGTATLTTTYDDAPGPYTAPISIGITFDGTRTSFSTAAFALTAATFSTPFGTNTTTIRHAGGAAGTFDEVSGALDVTLDLIFDQSISLPGVDSTFRVSLSSSNPGGSPRDPSNGAAALAGTGTFRGGVLAGETGTLLLAGLFEPIP